MHSAERATGKDIILDIVDNMRAYQEELLYSSMVPTAFDVHLHPDDYDRLQGIFPAITAEARRALNEELARQNRRIGPGWLYKIAHAPAPAQPAHDTWVISFFRDENDELGRGEVVIDSRLTLPQAPELGAGTRTRRITTSRIGQQTSTRTQTIEVPPSAPAAPVVSPAPVTPPPLPVVDPFRATAAPELRPSADATTRTATAFAVAPGVTTSVDAPAPVFATLTYEDNAGHHTHTMTEPQLVIGRGGTGYWVDLRVDAAPDVSREHARLRRDAETGQFFLKDVSTYGTTVNGEKIASSIDHANGGKRDINREVPLPRVARIGLADMVFLEFRATDVS
jgi:pSer/pThr/pTyr-binding forkhead associated (FHA) protein